MALVAGTERGMTSQVSVEHGFSSGVITWLWVILYVTESCPQVIAGVHVWVGIIKLRVLNINMVITHVVCDLRGVHFLKGESWLYWIETHCLPETPADLVPLKAPP